MTPVGVATATPAPTGLPEGSGSLRSVLDDVPIGLVTVVVVVVGSLMVGVATTLGPMFAMAAVVAVLFGLALLAWPTAAATLLPLIAVVSGLRRGFPIPGLRLSEVLAVVCAGTIFISAPRMRRLSWNGLDWCAFAYTAIAIVLPAYKAHGDGTLSTGTLMTLVGPVQFFLIYRAAAVASSTPGVATRMVRLLLLSSIPTNIVAVMQAFSVPGVREWVVSVTDVNSYSTPGFTALGRATGLFPHWHVLAGFDVIIVVLAIALWLGADRQVMRPRALVAVALLAAIGIGVSVTATSAIGAVAALFLLGLIARRLGQLLRWTVPAGVAGAIVFWPLVQARITEQGLGGDSGGGGTPQTIAYRLDVWTTQYLPAIKASPVTGYGDVIPERISWEYSESIYLSLLLRGGLVLFLAYVVWTVATLSVAAVTAASESASPAEVAVARTVLTVMLVLVPMQLLFPYLLNSGIPHALWLLIGLSRQPWGATFRQEVRLPEDVRFPEDARLAEDVRLPEFAR